MSVAPTPVVDGHHCPSLTRLASHETRPPKSLRASPPVHGEAEEIRETQEMLDFCAAHGLTSDIETIPIQKINEAYERLLKGDVKYRFVIDMASLKVA
jgi:hypothetical protein